MANLDFNYEFISDEDKIAIVEAQARQLETEHFSLSLLEPSKLQNSDAHVQWRSQIVAVESAIMRVREMLDIVISRSGADLDLVNDEFLLKMRQEEE